MVSAGSHKSSATERLEQQFKFEKLISQFSTRFINLPPDKIDAEINRSLRFLTEFMDVDYSCLNSYSEETGLSSTTHFYAKPALESFITHEDFREIPMSEFPYVMSEIFNHGMVCISDVDSLPREGKNIKKFMKDFGVQSILYSALIIDEKLIGALGFDSYTKKIDWSAKYISRLKLIGEIFANALMRKKNQEELAEAHRQLEVLKNQYKNESEYLQEEIKIEHNFDEIIGKSGSLKKTLKKVEQVAPTDSTVLILGETGTGKELIARAVHKNSARSDRPLIKVNCAALPTYLIESELFGHEKGAFTGAINQHIGRFEMAHKGTIFLDEIGEMPLELQVKLLRVLQEGEFERIGNPKTMNVNVRVIAATNRDLLKEVEAGNFRQDLYYRLNVFPVEVPPLRERMEDIPFLVRQFVSKTGKKIGKSIDTIPDGFVSKLKQHYWPGNIRELENIVERAVITSQGNILSLKDALIKSKPAPEQLSGSLQDVEKNYILKVLNACNWKIEGQSGASHVLGLNPSTLRSRMLKLGLKKELSA
ncbi:sigma 54-interacting transcriptional regulator [Allomuricauda sp. SCSIO 65647]|uniref:sigma-54-dependent Fis family transcriptional regulator n=1 Tax=Allomuricauda sp. SCSIO 65647 TaxID=2908843 RepID=UPI001F443859|nr:sigma 54-interacting transcriptional regulator [Muricauda sp. SCSIO 65647]UJH66595.1 sigma 54-interacting transcriptional regulator [Muricauda sp. SCSIO 65647]